MKDKNGINKKGRSERKKEREREAYNSLSSRFFVPPHPPFFLVLSSRIVPSLF
jgi:hypothetical protein